IGGIQSESVLPGDPTFNIIDNKYDIPSFKRIYAEFNIEWKCIQRQSHLIYFSRNDDDTERQFKYFMIEDSSGLSQAGLSRLNQSIEAFVYSILGAQVNVRSSILGNSESAKEAQTDVQRFQLAIDEAKVRLNLAVSPRAWLKPSNLVINTQSAVGYNNGLRKSGVRMKLGVNDSVNAD
ncbi:unnamed protein product, partial [Porites lobata]